MNATQPANFIDRRGQPSDGQDQVLERRQFAESRDSLNPEVRELAEAIDAYKLAHHRRYVTLAEVLEVIKDLGYRR